MEQYAEQYNNEFTIEERKQLIAEAMEKLRKKKGISQKEAAAAIGVSQAAYSAYERGRNEPPAEMLVRLSYLFGISTDMLVQRDRQFRNLEEATKQLQGFKEQLAQFDKEAENNPNVSPEMSSLRNAMGAFVDLMLDYSQKQSGK